MEACDARARGGRMLREAGYKEQKEDKKEIVAVVKKAMAEHDSQRHEAGHSHNGPTHLKLKRGGKTPGHEAKHRPDRRARGGKLEAFDQPDDADGNMVKDSGRARGGKVGKHGKVEINIHTGNGANPMMPHPGGPPMAPPMRPPMAPPGAGMNGPPMGMPPGGPPGGPPMMPPHPPMGPPPGAPGMPGMRARGGAMVHRDGKGRFSGGAV